LSLLLGLLRSRSGSFSFLRRRCECVSEEFCMLVGEVGGAAARCDCPGLRRLNPAGRGHPSAAMGSFDWASKAGTSRKCAYQRHSSPSMGETRQGKAGQGTMAMKNTKLRSVRMGSWRGRRTCSGCGVGETTCF
jgi:hypothetical protein